MIWWRFLLGVVAMIGTFVAVVATMFLGMRATLWVAGLPDLSADLYLITFAAGAVLVLVAVTTVWRLGI